jgi:DNA-directed RNA polymerase specialized sigma24 family protein
MKALESQSLIALRGAMDSDERDQMRVALWQATESRLSKFFRRWEDAEERLNATLDTTLIAWNRILEEIPTWVDEGKSADECMSYFYRTCRDVYAEYVCKQARRWNSGFSVEPTEDINLLMDQHHWSEDTFVEAIANGDLYDKVLRRIKQAKKEALLKNDVVRWRQWEAFELFYRYDFSITNIAAKLDVTEVTVKSDLFIVRQRFLMLLLREVEGLSHTEIAEDPRVKISSVAKVKNECGYMQKYFSGLLG